MRNNLRRLVALATAAVMAFSFVNVPVYAEGSESTDDIVVEETLNEEATEAEETGGEDTAVEEDTSTSETEPTEETGGTGVSLGLSAVLAATTAGVGGTNEIQTLDAIDHFSVTGYTSKVIPN